MEQVPHVVEQVLDRIDAWFLGDQEKLDRVRVFTQHGRQIEKWFTGELMYCLDGLLAEGLLAEWHPEVTLPEWWGQRKKLDFLLRCNDGQVALIEVKDLLIGSQSRRVWRGDGVEVTPTGEYRLRDYIGNGCDGWLLDTAHRLHVVLADAWKMILAFAHTAVTDEQARDLVTRLTERSGEAVLEVQHVRSSPDETLSIVWLRVH